jgi:hypothetical protein
VDFESYLLDVFAPLVNLRDVSELYRRCVYNMRDAPLIGLTSYQTRHPKRAARLGPVSSLCAPTAALFDSATSA